MEPWLEDNVTEMYSAQNEGKFVVAEQFISTLKKKIYNYMVVKSKSPVLINLIIQLINTIINTYYRTIKMNPTDVESSTYIVFYVKIMIKILILSLKIM